MKNVKKITALNMAVVIMAIGLTGCGSFNTEDMPDTYEDYMKLAAESYDRRDWENALALYQSAKELDDGREEVYRGMSDAYLQMDDVEQALAILDEGVEKCEIDLMSQNALSRRKEYVLAGVVAVRTKFIENDYDDEGNILSDCVSEYDESGNEIKSVYCRAGGEIGIVIEYQYDGDGNQIEYEYKSCDNDGNIGIFSHEIRAYDVNGNETEYAEYDENGNMEKRREYEYDENGNQIKERNYNKQDELISRAETEYDAAGNEIEHMVYDQYGSCKLKMTREYDENGNEVKYVLYNDAVTIDYWYEKEYDENGNEVRYVRYNAAGRIDCRYEKEYDENGNEVKFIRYDDGVTVGYWNEKEYDANGNLIKDVDYGDEGGIRYIREYVYDESGREICGRSFNENGVITHMEEFEYAGGEGGNIIKAIYTNYDGETGEKGGQTIDEYRYDDRENMTEYVCTRYDENGETDCRRWEREYDADSRETEFFLYDDGKKVSYQSKTEYEENGLRVNYTGYDEEGNVLVRKETEYDISGKVIRENDYDADGDPVQYYEKEYDDFGSVIRQAMYKDGILKSEKQIIYTYHYIGNIDAEVADYMDDVTLEEYNLKQREIFIRFLQGQETVRYRSRENSLKDGMIVRDTINDLYDLAYCRKNEEYPEYTFLDMTGDGIEELLIRCSLDKLYVIQYDHGVLKVICDVEEGNYGAYPVKWNGRTAVCCSFGSFTGASEEYYFLDGKGKDRISLHDYYEEAQEDGGEGWHYWMYDNDSFESCDLSEGEYEDITDKMITKIDIDWQKLEEPMH